MEFDKLMDYQKMLRQRLNKEDQLDKKIEILSIINQLTTGPKNLVQVEQILLEAASRGFSPEETRDIIDGLIKENIIYESSPGYIKKR